MISAFANPYKVCLVIPAGRRRYLEGLIPRLLKEPGWQTMQIWLNTVDTNDLEYLHGLPLLDPRIELVEPPEFPPKGSETIGQFFRHCVDPETVYIRLDDDVCWIEPGLIARLSTFRIAHPEPFLVTPVVVNNAICSFLLQTFGRLSLPGYMMTPNCLDPVTWGSPEFAEMLHRMFVEHARRGNVDHFKLPDIPIAVNRFSINCISWFGREFAKFGGAVPYGIEEEWLSAIKPTLMGGYNQLCGSAVIAHFAFYTQRAHLETTDLLAAYRAV